MTSPLRRSTRSARNADVSATTPEPSIASTSASPTKVDRKRKRVDEPAEPSNIKGDDEHGAGVSIAEDAAPTASADNEKTDGMDPNDAPGTSTPKKTQLPTKIQSLLGLPGSSISRQHSRSTEIDTAAEKVQELVLGPEDAQKLSAVVSTLSAADLLYAPPQSGSKARSRKTNGSATVVAALQDMLRPGTTLREIRSHLLTIRQPLLARPDIAQRLQAHDGPSSPQKENKDLGRLSSLTLLISLVDQLASRLRQTVTSTNAIKGQLVAANVEERARLLEAKNARKDDMADISDDDADLVKIRPLSLPTDDEPATRYALHMRLPRGDYFTKAIALDRAQLSQLDTAQSDIVQISAQSEDQMRALRRQGLVPTPTLGQRLGRSGPRHRTESKRVASQHLARPQPVTFLNYGNYASFAPTYDSSASTLSYATTSALCRHSAQAKRSLSLAWGDKPFHSAELAEQEQDDADQQAEAMAEPPLATAQATPQLVASRGKRNADVDGDVPMDGPHEDELASILRDLVQGTNPEDIGESLAKLSEDELITSHLRFNMMLLHRLQEFQWARLRRSYAPTTRGRSGPAPAEEEPPSVEEEATAALLLESLSSLAALQPRAVDLTSGAVESVVPEPSTLRAFSASSGAIDPELLGDARDGFWGALDANVVKVSKTGSVSSDTPLVLRDDMTIRLADSSGSKAKKSARRAGPGAGQPEHRGRGVLERFAASRTYDQQHDRHDIELIPAVVATSVGAEQRAHGSGTRDAVKGDVPSVAMRPGMPPASTTMAMSPNVRIHGGYGPGAASAMTPQVQRAVPGPNSSYAFASPGGGLSYGSRPVPPNPNMPHAQASFAHPAAGHSNRSGQV